MIDRFGSPVLVFDVGGSHVSAAVCYHNSWRLGPVCRVSYPPEIGPEAFFQLLHSLGLQAAAGEDPVAAAELAVPAPFDFDTGISRMQHKLQCLYGLDLRGTLAGRFGWNPDQVRFVHDAAAFLLGELTIGAARGIARAVGITLGTGIGSAFAVQGSLVTEGDGVPPGGEIWNLPFASGILEDSVSSRAIQRSYESRTGVNREVVELAALAQDDPAARDTFADFGLQLGEALQTTLSGFMPDVVVLGGGISHAARLFLPSAQRRLHGLSPRLEVSSMLDRAALVGAAAAWFNGGGSGHEPDSQSAPAATQSDAV